jgi:hypothetical protein
MNEVRFSALAFAFLFWFFAAIFAIMLYSAGDGDSNKGVYLFLVLWLSVFSHISRTFGEIPGLLGGCGVTGVEGERAGERESLLRRVEDIEDVLDGMV